MNAYNSTFVYGTELHGRGKIARKDVVLGLAMFILALTAVLLGTANLYLIKRMKIFHNVFGCFWASRTLGEVINNVVHVCYSAPVTIFQPTDIPVQLGISAFTIGYICALGSCLMHQIVSLNRFIAVYLPTQYNIIFATTNCIKIIATCWLPLPFIIACYVVFPCNLVGYSPQLYEYSFVKCSPDLGRDYSIVGTVINRACWTLCFITILTDICTLCRILYIRKNCPIGIQNANNQRDIGFFLQTTVQNFTMVIATTMIVVANNEYRFEDEVIHIFGFFTLIVTHVNNALALIVFNPEIRNWIRCRISVATSNTRYAISQAGYI